MVRRMWKGILLMSVVLLVFTACGGNPSEDGAGDTASDSQEEMTAEQVYNKNCVSCHGENLEGGFGPSLEAVGADLSKDEISEIIEKGRGQMQAQTQVSSTDREELAAWLAEKK